MSVLLTAAMVIATVIPTVDQDQVQGTFEARLDRSPYINLSITTEANGFSNWGRSIDRSDVNELRTADGRVTFKLIRPAGTFTLEGKGNESRVRGTFDFHPSTAYRQQLTALGLKGLTNERLFVLAMGDLSVADIKYIDQMTSDDVTTLQLVKMINHGVDVGFIKGLADAGFRNLRSDELINTRDHGVTPQYITTLQKFGYKVSLHDYVRAKDHGVNPDFIRRVAKLGYNDLTLEESIRLRDRALY